MTINEFRNKHCGRVGSTHHLHHLQLMGGELLEHYRLEITSKKKSNETEPYML